MERSDAQQTGRLGETLIREIMSGTDALQTISPSETVTDAAKKMRERKVSALPVVDENRCLVGIISERDLTSRCEQASEAEGLKTLFISSGGSHVPLALLSDEKEEETVNKLVQCFSGVGRTPVEQVMRTDVVTASEEDSVVTVLQWMHQRQATHIPVVKEERLVGIVARQDVLSALSKLAQEGPATAPPDDSPAGSTSEEA